MRHHLNLMHQAGLSGAVLVWLAWPTGAAALETAQQRAKTASQAQTAPAAAPARRHACFESPKFAAATVTKRRTVQRKP